MATWKDEELAYLLKYRTTAKSIYALWLGLKGQGSKHTLKEVERRIDSLGLVKPTRFNGHERVFAYLDIETTPGFQANFGHVLTWALKLRDGPTLWSQIKRKDMLRGKQDKHILEDLLATLRNVDLVVTYYGTGFDIPYLRSRCMFHGIEFPARGTLKHIDVFYGVKYKLKLHRSSLDAACSFLGIRGKNHVGGEWIAAMSGDQKALDSILDHNIRDVRILKRLHKRLELDLNPVAKTV